MQFGDPMQLLVNAVETKQYNKMKWVSGNASITVRMMDAQLRGELLPPAVSSWLMVDG